MTERKKRVLNTYKHRFNHSCEAIFKLLCPVREDDWIPGWRERRRLVYSESGYAELGCVFATTHQPHLMGPATWVNNVYQPFERVQYAAVNENLVYQIQADLKQLDMGCEVYLTRTWTALTAEAEEFLRRMQAEAGQKAPDLFLLIEHYLATGKMVGGH